MNIKRYKLKRWEIIGDIAMQSWCICMRYEGCNGESNSEKLWVGWDEGRWRKMCWEKHLMSTLLFLLVFCGIIHGLDTEYVPHQR